MKCLMICSLLVALVFLSVTISSQAAEVHPDEFDGPAVHESFQWQNQPAANWDVGKTRPGWIHFEGTYGGNLWCADDSTRLYQEIGDEDFEIETRLFHAWTVAGVAGLVVKSLSDDNWVMLKLWARAGGVGQLQFQKKCVESGDGLAAKVAGYDPKNETDLWLRLRREGDKCTGFLKTEEGADWTEIGTTSFPFKAPYQVGIFGWNNTLEFDYFRDNTSPFMIAVSPKASLTAAWGSIKK